MTLLPYLKEHFIDRKLRMRIKQIKRQYHSARHFKEELLQFNKH